MGVVASSEEFDAELGAGHPRGALGGLDEPAVDVLYRLAAETPDVVPYGRPVRDDVGGFAGLLVGVVDPRLVGDVLPEVVRANAEKLAGVERGAPEPRSAGGVSRLALVVEYCAVDAAGDAAVDHVLAAAVPGKREVELSECSAPRHEGLAREHLLSRAAVEHHRSRKSAALQIGLHRYGSSEGGGPEQVVSAAVSRSSGDRGIVEGALLLREARQSVVLREQADDGMSAAPDRPYGRGHAVEPGLHLEAVLPEGFGHPAARPHFVVGCLGIVVYPQRKRLQALRAAVDRVSYDLPVVHAFPRYKAEAEALICAPASIVVQVRGLEPP